MSRFPVTLKLNVVHKFLPIALAIKSQVIDQETTTVFSLIRVFLGIVLLSLNFCLHLREKAVVLFCLSVRTLQSRVSRHTVHTGDSDVLHLKFLGIN